MARTGMAIAMMMREVRLKIDMIDVWSIKERECRILLSRRCPR
jgi:hypothetical protein